jgi:hypothetical protein
MAALGCGPEPDSLRSLGRAASREFPPPSVDVNQGTSGDHVIENRSGLFAQVKESRRQSFAWFRWTE